MQQAERAERGHRVLWLAGPALWIAAFTLSCRLSAGGPAGVDDSAAGALLGSSRGMLAWHLYEQADHYFHGGVPHVRKRAFENDLYGRVRRLLKPSAHIHLSGSGVAEIMPWLWMSLRMDPRRVDTYRVAAFWLNQIGHTDTALDVLLAGQRAIPFNAAIQVDRGRILIAAGRIGEAVSAFDAALAFNERAARTAAARNESDEDTAGDRRRERAEALLYRALLHEIRKQPAAAAACLSELLELFPERTVLEERRAALSRGEEPSVQAEALLATIQQEADKRRDACHRDDHDHDHDHDHGQGRELHGHGGSADRADAGIRHVP